MPAGAAGERLTPESFACRATCMYDSDHRAARRSGSAKCDSRLGAYDTAGHLPHRQRHLPADGHHGGGHGRRQQRLHLLGAQLRAGDALKFCGPGAVDCTKRCLNAVAGDTCYTRDARSFWPTRPRLTLAQQTNLDLNSTSSALGNVTPATVTLTACRATASMPAAPRPWLPCGRLCEQLLAPRARPAARAPA